MIKLRERPHVEHNGVHLQIFSDLAKETLNRRRALRPLLDLLRSKDIQYRWGFPACLIAKRHGKTSILRFPEELEAFCESLQVKALKLPEWSDILQFFPPLQDPQWKTVGAALPLAQ